MFTSSKSKETDIHAVRLIEGQADPLYMHSNFAVQPPHLGDDIRGRWLNVLSHPGNEYKSIVLGGAFSDVQSDVFGKASGGGHHSGTKQGSQASVTLINHLDASLERLNLSKEGMVVAPVGACVLNVRFNQKECVLIVGGIGFGCEIRTILTRSNTLNSTGSNNLIADNRTLANTTFFANEGLSGTYPDPNGNDIVCLLGGYLPNTTFEYITERTSPLGLRVMKLNENNEPSIHVIKIVLHQSMNPSFFTGKTFFGANDKIKPIGPSSDPGSVLIVLAARLAARVEEDVGTDSVYVLKKKLVTRIGWDGRRETETVYEVKDYSLPYTVDGEACWVQQQDSSILIFDREKTSNKMKVSKLIPQLDATTGNVSFTIQPVVVVRTCNGGLHNMDFLNLGIVGAGACVTSVGSIVIVGGNIGGNENWLNNHLLTYASSDPTLLSRPPVNEEEEQIKAKAAEQNEKIAMFRQEREKKNAAKAAATAAAKAKAAKGKTPRQTSSSSNASSAPIPRTFKESVADMYDDMKVAKLKEELKKKNLSTTGRKKELVERLVNFRVTKWEQELHDVAVVTAAFGRDATWEILKRRIHNMNYGELEALHNERMDADYVGEQDDVEALRSFLLSSLIPSAADAVDEAAKEAPKEAAKEVTLVAEEVAIEEETNAATKEVAKEAAIEADTGAAKDTTKDTAKDTAKETVKEKKSNKPKKKRKKEEKKKKPIPGIEGEGEGGEGGDGGDGGEEAAHPIQKKTRTSSRSRRSSPPADNHAADSDDYAATWNFHNEISSGLVYKYWKAAHNKALGNDHSVFTIVQREKKRKATPLEEMKFDKSSNITVWDVEPKE